MPSVNRAGADVEHQAAETAGGFQVLAAADSASRQEWLRRWAQWPGREPFAHPAYVELFLDPGEQAICLVWDRGGTSVLFPAVLRPLPPQLGRPGYDLTSPYGYGGPFLVAGTADGAAEFWAEFAAWARGQGIVSAFSRLSLFGDELLPVLPGVVRSSQRNVVVDLRPDADVLWRSYEHKVRKNVNRARREGLEFEIDPTGETMAEFEAIYEATMERRDAAESYRFAGDFFARIRDELGGSFVVAGVRDAGKLVSTELALVAGDKVYSFLGGTLQEAFPKRPNDLLKHELISWSKAAGKNYFVLGGGYGSDDGIFRYKASFAPGGQLPFSTWRYVVDPDGYQDLEARHAAAQAVLEGTRPAFFPAYRA